MFDFRIAITRAIIEDELLQKYVGEPLTKTLLEEMKWFVKYRLNYFYSIGEIDYIPDVQVSNGFDINSISIHLIPKNNDFFKRK